MLNLLVSLFLAVAPAAPEQVESTPSASGGSAVEVPAKPEPKVKCRTESITGTRAKKRMVCRTPEYERRSEQQRDMMRGILNGSGNVQPTLPPGVGG